MHIVLAHSTQWIRRGSIEMATAWMHLLGLICKLVEQQWGFVGYIDLRKPQIPPHFQQQRSESVVPLAVACILFILFDEHAPMLLLQQVVGHSSLMSFTVVVLMTSVQTMQADIVARWKKLLIAVTILALIIVWW